MTPVAALAAVPRERFIPDRIYVPGPEGWLVELHRDQDPDAWHAHVHSPEPVVTQVGWDPRMPEHLRDETTGRGRESTSSSSGLEVMARMLDALELTPGTRVLEIGTGTGYHAAVLAHLVGPDHVTSVEVDADVADRARAAIDGYGVTVVVGDGREGHPDGAPYDRIVATAAITDIPLAWWGQLAPGGWIVAPWDDGTLHITTRDGTRIEEDAPFMAMR